ncbi:MAG: molecular chaperone TorD family protein [Burkholderiaceae bacterium]|nr:molecular chaperone TorD family protein [Burkholderiaceae bacterium]
MLSTPESMHSSALDEETARAELYGLLALLFYASPATESIAQLRVAVTEAPAAGAFLEGPWRSLVGLSRAMTDLAIQNEYNELFGGVGKPEVYLYGSHFLSGFLNEKPLARLRTELTSLGLERDENMPETQDHFAYLCEVMRYLIAGDDVAVANLTRQRAFFSVHIQPWVMTMCNDIQQHPKARFYAALAELTRAFMDIEAQGFDMLA